MSVGDLLNVPAALLTRTPGPPDEYGNPTTLAVSVPTVCELQQSGAREELDGNVQVVTWLVFLPASAPARGWDALDVDGRVLELNGDAWAVRNPRTGELSHVQAYLTETA